MKITQCGLNRNHARTEEGNAGGISCMEALSVLPEILGAGHQPTHGFQDALCALRNLVPGSF